MKKIFLSIIALGLVCGLVIAAISYSVIFLDNVKDNSKGFHEVFIPSDADYKKVQDILLEQKILKRTNTFDWVAQKMNYPNTIEAGKYEIPNHFSNRQLIQMLRYGIGEKEVEITINSVNSPEELFEKIGQSLEVSKEELQQYFSNETVLQSNQLTKETGWAIILADTYKFHWDTDAKSFFDKMLSEYNSFWTDERISKAMAKGLTPMDCIVIASIVEKESSKRDEYQEIAGVYVNRVNIGMPLQADPTVKFALKEPGLKRILHKHLEIDSPYNTYKYPGIPPGPICLPEKTAIDGVINASKHDYLYFCARADFSGYHDFTVTYTEHLQNARLYQKALDKRKVK
jgi:UPF0755 protein